MAPVSMCTADDQSEKYSTSSLGDNDISNENQIEETDDLLARDGACLDDESLDREVSTDNQNITGELNGHDSKENGKINQDKIEKSITLDENSAPDGGWGWFVVLGALLLRSVIGGLGKSHGLFYIQFKEKFNGTATATALVTSLTCFLRLSAGPFVSILSGRFRIRTLTSIGTVVLFIGIILTGFGRSLYFLYFSYGVVAGLGRALTLTPVPIQLGYYFNKRKSLAFGLASAGFSIGGFAITPIVELLFKHYGYQGTFLILSGFALNVLVSSALFRPIELHRKLTAQNRKAKMTETNSVKNSMVLKSLEHVESGVVVCSSAVSVNDDKTLAVTNTTTSLNHQAKSSNSTDLCQKLSQQSSTENNHNHLNGNSNVGNDANHYINADIKSEIKASLLSNTSEGKGSNNSDEKFGKRNTSRLCCFKGKHENDNSNTKDDNKKKTKLISWSVLKDTRFLCFVFATFCFTLPSTTLFLPSLAKTKGVSDIQAATLLSVSAGCDTVFRVISGFVLDLKIFRSSRPLIYNIVTFLQAITAGLFPLMSNYTEFILLCILEGTIAGIKSAQGAVIMIDMLGVDKLASSLAVTMTIQCAAVFLGPTISGQFIDRYGSYNGAFYFGAGAILLGGIVLLVGNIANHYRNIKTKKHFKDSENSSN